MKFGHLQKIIFIKKVPKMHINNTKKPIKDLMFFKFCTKNLVKHMCPVHICFLFSIPLCL